MDELGDVLVSFYNSNLIKTTTNLDIKNGRQIVRLEIPADTPIRISIIVADIINNLRSALDYIAWELAKLGCSTPDNQCKFPILIDRPRGGLKSSPRLKGISIEAINEIELLQPYRRTYDPRSHPLWLLKILSNHDKHRSIITRNTHVTGLVPINGFNHKVINNHTVDISFPSVNQNLEPDITLFNLSVEFWCNRLDSGVTEDTLVEIYEFVRDTVLPSFMRFFP